MDKNENTLAEQKHDDDLFNFFENFLKPGVIVREKEVVPGFSVKLKVLNTEELLVAESILLNASGNIPFDVLQKVRGASILSQAIISLNGMAVERDDMSKEENRSRRSSLYNQLLKMPSILIQKTYEFYVDAVVEQNKIYDAPEKISQNIENFSERRSEE